MSESEKLPSRWPSSSHTGRPDTPLCDRDCKQRQLISSPTSSKALSLLILMMIRLNDSEYEMKGAQHSGNSGAHELQRTHFCKQIESVSIAGVSMETVCKLCVHKGRAYEPCLRVQDRASLKKASLHDRHSQNTIHKHKR